MLAGGFLDKLSAVLGGLRGSTSPFGGIQVVFSGDFLQLGAFERPRDAGDAPLALAFESAAWAAALASPDQIVALSEPQRQRDRDFFDLLSRVRVGRPTSRDVAVLMSRGRAGAHEDDAVVLYATAQGAREHNERCLDALGADAQRATFTRAVHTDLDGDSEELRLALSGLEVPKDVVLAVGARVMVTRNLPGMYNGAMGTVLGLVYADTDDDDDDVESVPPEQATAVVVRLELEGGAEDVVLEPTTWEVTSVTGEVVLSAFQIPLILAWAFTVHRVQSISLVSVRIDARSTFAGGQLYTALSRVRSLDGLTLVGFARHHVKVDDRALAYCEDHGLVPYRNGDLVAFAAGL